MTAGRLPWEVVETLPHSDPTMITAWEGEVRAATTKKERVSALVGHALALYWAPALGIGDTSSSSVADQRRRAIDLAESLARTTEDADVLGVALLGRLYALWGPPDPTLRGRVIAELADLRPSIVDPELRARIVEWQVLQCFDSGDLGGARVWIEEFLVEAAHLDSMLFSRREVLWRANIEMLEGHLDESVRLNEEAIASTADLAGSPFSFQNVAITMAISKYLQRGLADMIDAIRSIRASSPRVEANWDVALAFALSEVGELDEARELFDELAADSFAAVPRDLNWLVATSLLGLVAVNLNDRQRALELLVELRTYAKLDATHGSGYASYGPVGRVVGLLAACAGEESEAEFWFDFVLSSREPGPWTALTRSDRAGALRENDPVAALLQAKQAERDLREHGLVARADGARTLATEIRLGGHGGPLAKLSTSAWTLRHPTGVARVKDRVGMGALCHMLAHPGTGFDVLDLDHRVVATVPRTSVVEPSIDPSARGAYRRRIRELEEMTTRTQEQEVEHRFLVKELAGARNFAAASKEIEKTRVRVTTAIRRTIATIADASPSLGEHLNTSITTGRTCMYQPADGTAWRIER